MGTGIQKQLQSAQEQATQVQQQAAEDSERLQQAQAKSEAALKQAKQEMVQVQHIAILLRIWQFWLWHLCVTPFVDLCRAIGSVLTMSQQKPEVCKLCSLLVVVTHVVLSKEPDADTGFEYIRQFAQQFCGAQAPACCSFT